MMHLLFLLLSVFISTLTKCYWINGWDAGLAFHCPIRDNKHGAIKRIESYHSNHHEDRRWHFECSYDVQRAGHCHWTGWLNGWDAELRYNCPNNGYIAGLNSYHDNHREDRRWRVLCCVAIPGLEDCKWTGYINGWDAHMNYNVPSGRVINGLYSHHSNHREDRIWRVYECRLKNSCKAGWTFFSRTGLCYKYIAYKKSHIDAKNYCKSLSYKGSLVSIHNKETNSFILSLTGQTHTWLGGYRVYDGHNKWAWYDGTSWDYAPWASGEPNDYGGKEDFLGLYKSGYWNDFGYAKNFGLSFVCQAPPTYGRALNQATEDTSGEHAEAYQEYDVDPKERELLEQQNFTSVLERESEGNQSLEMIDSPIETLYQSENEGLDVKSEDDEIKFEDEEINDEEGEMEDENDMEDEHQMEDDH